MGQIVRKNRKSILMELSDDKNREEAMKKIQRSIIFVIGILLWVMQGQSVFAAGSAELLSGTIANTTISYRLTADGTLTIYSDNIEKMPNYTVKSTDQLLFEKYWRLCILRMQFLRKCCDTGFKTDRNRNCGV